MAALTHPLESALAVIVLSLAGITMAQVLFRYLFHMPLSWAEEMLRILMMWLTMLGAAYAFKVKAHFAFVLLSGRLRGTPRKVVVVTNTLLMATFLGIFFFYSLVLVQSSMTRIVPITGIPMAVPYSSTVVGTALILYYLVREAVLDVRRTGQLGPRIV